MDSKRLPVHVRALLEPGILGPEPPQLIQTHISYVLLTDDRAYKLKKPVNFGFLDYSTLERRRVACGAEVDLNRRLTDGVYLGVLPVTSEHGSYRLNGAGDVVDWAVVMRRLPEARMMNRLVERDAVTPEMLDRLARHLAAFYTAAPTGGHVNGYAEPGAILANWQENFAQALPFVGRTIGARNYRGIVGSVHADLLRLRSLWQQRIADGHARDCHGDLRCSAVCLEDTAIQVYDCIEFNERFRFGDVAADVAVLAMDLDGLRRPDLADEFIAAFVAASGDVTLPAVLRFYQCYRAYVRGKVDSFQLDEPEVAAAQRRTARQNTRTRFRLAQWYARRQPLTLALVTGTDDGDCAALAAALAARLGAVLLEDGAELALAGAWLRQGVSVVVPAPVGVEAWEALANRHRARLVRVAYGLAQRGGALVLPAGLPLRATLNALHQWPGPGPRLTPPPSLHQL